MSTDRDADPYRRLSARVVYRNPWVAVEAHEIVHPNGAPGEHLLLALPQASAVVVIDGDDVILTRQPRFGARAWVSEVVKGGGEPGESALACAQRELREETGLVARRWEPLGHVHEIPSIVAPPVALFLASDLAQVETEMEAVESIDVERVPFSAAFAAARDGGLDDAVTIAALLRAAARLGRI